MRIIVILLLLFAGLDAYAQAYQDFSARNAYGKKVVNAADGTNATDLVTKQQLDAVSAAIPPTATLQSVTNAGATTTNNIAVGTTDLTHKFNVFSANPTIAIFKKTDTDEALIKIDNNSAQFWQFGMGAAEDFRIQDETNKIGLSIASTAENVGIGREFDISTTLSILGDDNVGLNIERSTNNPIYTTFFNTSQGYRVGLDGSNHYLIEDITNADRDVIRYRPATNNLQLYPSLTFSGLSENATATSVIVRNASNNVGFRAINSFPVSTFANDANYTTPQTFGQVTTLGNTTPNTIVLNNIEALHFESGKHAITRNTNGNFNLRVAASSAGLNTEAGYSFDDQFNQAAGWRKFFVSSASLNVNDPITWREQVKIDPNVVELNFQGANKFSTTSTGINVVGNIIATGGNSTNWNTAFGWGNHAAAGYINDVNVISQGTINNVETFNVQDQNSTLLSNFQIQKTTIERFEIDGSGNIDLDWNQGGSTNNEAITNAALRNATAQTLAQVISENGNTATATGDVVFNHATDFDFFRLQGGGTLGIAMGRGSLGGYFRTYKSDGVSPNMTITGDYFHANNPIYIGNVSPSNGALLTNSLASEFKGQIYDRNDSAGSLNQVMTADASGWTWQTKSAKVKTVTGTLTINNSTAVFDFISSSENINNDGMLNLGGNYLVAPVAGTYLITVGVQADMSDGEPFTVQLRDQTNASVYDSFDTRALDENAHHQNFTFMLDLAQSDRVEVAISSVTVITSTFTATVTMSLL